MYNIYTFDLECSIKQCHVLQYADDLLLYTSGHSVDEISGHLTEDLKCLNKWLDENGLVLSLTKSNVILFSRKRHPPSVNICYGDTPLPLKNHTKFLRVILDSKLTAIPHCEHIIMRCARLLNILRCLTGVWWGAHPVTMRLLYNALIRSVLD